jgi:hypothetical protein
MTPTLTFLPKQETAKEVADGPEVKVETPKEVVDKFKEKMDWLDYLRFRILIICEEERKVFGFLLWDAVKDNIVLIFNKGTKNERGERKRICARFFSLSFGQKMKETTDLPDLFYHLQETSAEPYMARQVTQWLLRTIQPLVKSR